MKKEKKQRLGFQWLGIESQTKGGQVLTISTYRNRNNGKQVKVVNDLGECHIKCGSRTMQVADARLSVVAEQMYRISE
jgi:hypothetical protein